jgi:transcriptional regulator
MPERLSSPKTPVVVKGQGAWRRIVTIRRQIARMLRDGEFTARDISQILGIREKEVYEHLPHVERSAGPGENLIVQPARCMNCGFVFAKRKRFTSPGRCPVCRSESISRPVYGMRGKRVESRDAYSEDVR